MASTKAQTCHPLTSWLVLVVVVVVQTCDYCKCARPQSGDTPVQRRPAGREAGATTRLDDPMYELLSKGALQGVTYAEYKALKDSVRRGGGGDHRYEGGAGRGVVCEHQRGEG